MTPGADSGEMGTSGGRTSTIRLAWVAGFLVVPTCIFGLMHFDLDEFASGLARTTSPGHEPARTRSTSAAIARTLAM
jgi:hypothetical protein